MSHKLVSIILGLGLTACGSATLDLEETLTVAMLGVFEAPAEATGNAEPRSQTYNLLDVSLIGNDGSLTDLYTDDAKEIRVVNRSQIIHEADISDYAELSYAGIRVEFAPAVVGAGKLEDELAVTLTDPVVVYAAAFTVEKAIAQRLEIYVQWKNTITRDEEADPVTEVMSLPTFGTELVDGD